MLWQSALGRRPSQPRAGACPGVSSLIGRPDAKTMPDILSVRGLTKSFGAVSVASDVSFDVAEGEILGVIGPNGAGKTTLFGMLSGHVEPSSGTVVFRGEDITALPTHDRARRGIARTYQVPRPFGQMTVFDN